jgi:hypothetical protein
LADETFDVVIDKAAMDAMMAVDVWNPSQIWYWTKRGLCQHVSRILVPGGHFFANIPWRKFILIIATDWPASLPRRTATHTNYARLLLTDKHIFANFTC